MAWDMAQDDKLDVQPLNIGLDDNEDASGTKDDQDSVARAISSTWKKLFASALSKDSTATARRMRTWRPITPKDLLAQAERGGKGAIFATETVFHECSSTPTGGNNIASKLNDCVVRMLFKLQPCDVQKNLVGLLAHCLLVLQERDKLACILYRRKTLEAKRVSHLPRDFTNFYNKWGLWEEDIKMFLNTIKDKGKKDLHCILLLPMLQ
jgi:hypothetical protein